MTVASAERALLKLRADYADAWRACGAGAGDDSACDMALEIAAEIALLEAWLRDRRSARVA